MSGTFSDYIEYRINKSKETLADAILLSENERWNSALNRLSRTLLGKSPQN